MSDVDISRERIERLKEIGCADYLHIALLDRIEQLEAALKLNQDLDAISLDHVADLEAKLQEFQKSQSYSYIGRNMKAILARDLEDRAERAEAKLAKAVEGLMKIKSTYYREAANPSPETIRRMAACMNGIARDTIAEINGGGDK